MTECRELLSIFRDPLTIGGGGPEMVVIPAGEFLMGAPEYRKIGFLGLGGSEGEESSGDDERPQHRVRFAQPFALGLNAVTFAEYDLFCEATARDKPEDEGWGRDRRPVINVSWNDTVVYAIWLSKQTGAEYRLPSEAEWEYACRAGTTTPFAFGESLWAGEANFDDSLLAGGSSGVFREHTVPVDELDAANAWGLRHMHGNVFEWVQDCWHHNYVGAPEDGSAWMEGDGGDCSVAVVRDGAWDFPYFLLRSASRGHVPRESKSVCGGFRVARTLTP